MAKVLIIDDDANLTNILSIFLSGQGWTVATAFKGEEGISLAKAGRPDIILLDIQLPDVEGFECAQRLRAAPETAGTPIILISGNRTQAEDILRGLDSGSQAYILKPFDLRVVLARMKAVMGAGK